MSLRYAEQVLVTGGSGFVGKYVVAWLLEHDVRVRALVRSPFRAPFSFHEHLDLVTGDLLDEESLVRALDGVSAVVHLAANKYDPRVALDTNVGGARNLARACERVGVWRLINISTQSAKIEQKGVYGTTKRQAEDVFRNSNLGTTTLRPSLVYGPDEDSLFGFIARQVMKLPAVPVLGSGQWRMRPVHADDVGASILACIENDATIGRTYDIGGSEEISLNELIALIGELTGKDKVRTFHIPFKVSLALAHLVAAVMKNPPIRPDNVLGSNQQQEVDIRPMLEELKIEPTPLRDGARFSLLGKRYRPNAVHVVVVGLGKIGLLHSAIVNQIPQALLVGVSDRNPKLGVTARSMGLHVPFDTSLPGLLDRVHPAAVFVCTPTFAHDDIIRICLDRRISIFVEKPLTQSFEKSEALARQAEKSGCVTAAGYFFRYRRTFRKAKELLDAGVLGTVRSFFASCYHSEVFAPKEGWLFEKARSGGGVLINPTSHLFDLLHWYFGVPRSVSAETKRLFSKEVEDQASVDIEFEGGVRGRLAASWSVPDLPILRNTIEVEGTNGTMKIEHEAIQLSLREGLDGWHAGASVIHESTLPQPGVFDLNPQAGGEAYFLQDLAFVRACLGQPDDILAPLHRAVEAERMIHAAYQSASSGHAVTFAGTQLDAGGALATTTP